MNTDNSFRSGFISLMGSPNVGKSTLVNAFIGAKVTIVSPRAQTTRNKVTGILTLPDCQMIFLDTPGVHLPKNRLGEYMVRTAYNANRDVDVTLMLTDAKIGVHERDEGIIERLRTQEPFLVAINKTDIVSTERVSMIQQKLESLGVSRIFRISALTGEGLPELLEAIKGELCPGPKYYPDDMMTDRPERFIAGELIREAALCSLREEIPHGVGVEIERIEEYEDITEVYACVYCERDSHKGMIIGKGGSMLKRIGSDARVELERLFGTQVFLKIFVKVKEDWRNSMGMLKTLGYSD